MIHKCESLAHATLVDHHVSTGHFMKNIVVLPNQVGGAGGHLFHLNIDVDGAVEGLEGWRGHEGSELNWRQWRQTHLNDNNMDWSTTVRACYAHPKASPVSLGL